jgi:hypothetical protein
MGGATDDRQMGPVGRHMGRRRLFEAVPIDFSPAGRQGSAACAQEGQSSSETSLWQLALPERALYFFWQPNQMIYILHHLGLKLGLP